MRSRVYNYHLDKFMHCLKVINGLVLFAAVLSVTGCRSSADWWPSCSPNLNSVSSSGSNYVFRESTNNCGSIDEWSWKQRAEVASSRISETFEGTYLFESTISLDTASDEKLTILQIHDGRDACAPPLKLDWSPDNLLRFESHYKVEGKGEEYCIPNMDLRNAARAGSTILTRNGQEYHLEALFRFGGNGSFSIDISIDGQRELIGFYDSKKQIASAVSEGGLVLSRPIIESSGDYYFKHGVYSRNYFSYTLQSNNMSLKKLSDN